MMSTRTINKAGIQSWKARVDKSGFILIWPTEVINNFLHKRNDPQPLLAATTLTYLRIESTGEVFVPTMHKLQKNFADVRITARVKFKKNERMCYFGQNVARIDWL